MQSISNFSAKHQSEAYQAIELYHENRFVLAPVRPDLSRKSYMGQGKEAIQRFVNEQPKMSFHEWVKANYTSTNDHLSTMCGIPVAVDEYKFCVPTVVVQQECAPSIVESSAWELFPDGYGIAFTQDIMAKFWAKYANECRAMLDSRKGYEPREIVGYTYTEIMMEELGYAVAYMTDKEGNTFKLVRVQSTEIMMEEISFFICKQELEQAHKTKTNETPLD